MRVFLTASTYGRQHYLDVYQRITNLIKSEGHTPIAHHLLENSHEEMITWTEQDRNLFYNDWLNELKQADVVFAEVSYTSTSVGYVVANVVNMGKPVIVFYNGDKEPNIFKTLEVINDKFTMVRYRHIDDLDREVPLMLRFASENQDTRFNFFVSPEIYNYLNYVSKSKKLPRSVFLRRLIDEDMAVDEEYQNG